mmetsp:Transcript_17430/g.54414  ORF Transcript_17430/g.54414 Transcript_17430/m.54414 type:complete len:131 (-) Transcript_17430:64-456(-)
MMAMDTGGDGQQTVAEISENAMSQPVETEIILSSGSGGLTALEEWLRLNEDSFRAWPGLTKIAWTRVPGRASVALRLGYRSHRDLEQNYDRWNAAAELMERTVLGSPPSQTAIVASQAATSGSSVGGDSA